MSGEERRDLRWWRQDDKDAARAMTALIKRIRMRQEGRKLDQLMFASLYGNVELFGFGVGAQPRRRSGIQLSLNVVRNMVGAVVSRIAAKSKPKPAFITEGGNWELRRKAKKLDKAVDGTFYQSGFFKKYPTIFRDCAIFGTGFCKWMRSPDGKRPVCERVLPGEITVDDGEALYGDPPSIYQHKYYDRVVASEKFGIDLEGAPSGEADGAETGFDRLSDQVLIYEGWHQPIGEDKGRHIIAIDGFSEGPLVAEPWERERHPIASLHWDAPLTGFFADGLVHELTGIQLEINDLLDEIQEGHHCVKGAWLVEQSAEVNLQQINDEIGKVLLYKTAPPRHEVFGVIAPEVYQHLWNLYQRAYEIAGISQLAAQSQKPAGLNSGIAQREYADQQSERFLNLYQSCEEFVLDNARLAIDEMRAIAAEHDFKVKARSDDYLEEIDFKENDLEEHAYELKVMPISMVPSTVAGKLEFIEDMSKIPGMVDPEELLDLLQMPDTERLSKRKNATRHLTEQMLEKIVESGEFQSPEPEMDLRVALKVSVESYLEFRYEGVPDDKLDLVRRWIGRVRALQKMQAAAQAPAVAPPPVAGPPANMNGAPPAPMAAGAEGQVLQ